MTMVQLLESILPAIILYAISGFITLKISAVKTEMIVAGLKTSLDANDKMTGELKIAVEKRNTEMEGVHRELKELKTLTDVHSREISELRTTLARMEAKLDILITGANRANRGD